MICLSCFMPKWTILIPVILYFFYKWLTSTYNFFKDKNVPFIRPLPLFGNFFGMIQNKSGFDLFREFYNHFSDKKFYGLYAFKLQNIVVKDPELIKQITVKDFDHFVNHYCMVEEQDAPIFVNSLFFLKDQKWRNMRSTLSPAFTGSKMRLMFQLIDETCRTAIEHLKSETQKKGTLDVEIKEFFTRYTSDVIATTAFGLKVDSLSNKNNEFFKMGRSVSDFTIWVIFKLFFIKYFRKVFKMFGAEVFKKRDIDYFYNLVIDTIKYRSKNNILRPDMINLLMEARQGKLKPTSDDLQDINPNAFEEKVKSNSNNQEWSDIETVAQCFLFFIAGFETTAILMCFCAQELMENPDVQQELLKEIDEVNRDLNGKPLTYDVLQKMKYLDMVISETLRKWPPSIQLDRICSKPYTIVDDINGNSFTIERNSTLTIPVAGIHRDPQYYPNPDKFDPERFNDENKGNINPFTYLPFGIGPRFCIGSRLALMESKAIIFHLLSAFTFDVSKKSDIPIKLSPGFVLRAKNGFWIKLKPRI